MNDGMIVIENSLFRLIVDRHCKARSLVVKATGEECLCNRGKTALFSVTQERPYNNEIKLSHPNKRITCEADSICRDGNTLTVGFELAPYKAVIEIQEAQSYVSFHLKDFIVDDHAYASLRLTPPPVSEFRIMQLPVRARKNYGEWLNVMSDAKSAVCVLGTDRFARIDSQRCSGGRILTADAISAIQLRDTGAALIACETDRFMDAVDQIEQDYHLPRGAENRRGPLINSSVMWVNRITPENVDDCIKYARLGGFKLMLIYYTAFFEEEWIYGLLGDYRFNACYPNGIEDIRTVIKHLKEAGILPGLHFLHTHIGLKSRYVSPQCDYRLNIKKEFTLKERLNSTDTQLYVHEAPTEATMCDGCRVLRFDGELMTYEAYTTVPPYRFLGLKRGSYGTLPTDHEQGRKGGILDISEFGARSAYIDQRTDLQDEIAEKIAEIYNLGFAFAYFDGSEGTNAPYDFHIPNAQYRVYSRFKTPPLFCEGAAKSHFSWHMLSGGNAFDIFPAEVFKSKIREFPLEEAPRMRSDFTRLDFGWWNGGDLNLQTDMIEYGTSKAAAWDCPATIQFNLDTTPRHPRFDDLMETFKRWEDVRQRNLLSPGDKRRLRNAEAEYTLIRDGKDGYDLVRIYSLELRNDSLRAFLLKWRGKRMIMYWHKDSEAMIQTRLPVKSLHLFFEPSEKEEAITEMNGYAILPAGRKRFVYTDLSMDTLTEDLSMAVVIPQ